MSTPFSDAFSGLRHKKNISQRQAANDLNISQALLSHYENGLREPRLEFVVKACEYYGVSADYILGRTKAKENPRLTTISDEAENDNVKYLLGALSGAYSVCQSADKKISDKVYLYFCVVIYKMCIIFGAADDMQAMKMMNAPRESFAAICDAAIKTLEADIILDAGSREIHENMKNSYKLLKQNYPTIFEEFVKVMSDSDVYISKIVGRGDV